jgi:3-oxoacyl-[acyl-carrier protein] reductase
MSCGTTRVALITGAAGGIGSAICRLLAEDSYSIVAVDIDSDGVQKLVHQIETAGGRAWALTADFSKTDEVTTAIGRAIELAGHLDVLVNNAGMGGIHDFLTYPHDLWQQVLALNLTAPMFAAQAAVRHMAPRRQGVIINIASISSFVANGGRAAYSATKTALAALTRQMAIEFGKDNIRVNAVAPGFILTNIVGDMASAAEQWAERSPIGRPGLPDEIANVVRFLAGDDAQYVSGHTLIADGGFLVTGLLDGGLSKIAKVAG